MILPLDDRAENVEAAVAWGLTLYCLTWSRRLHRESKADSTSPSPVMAAGANPVRSTTQQIGARSGRNPIEAVATGCEIRVAIKRRKSEKERLLNL